MNDWRKGRLGKKKRQILSAPRKKLRHNLRNLLVKRTETSETADTNNIQATSEDKQVTQEEKQTVDEIEEFLEHSGSTSETSETNIKTPLSSKQAKLPTKKCKSTATKEALSIMKEIKERNTNSLKDQYIAFGEQVGMRIRDLTSEHAKKIVKHLMSTILFEAEMGKYDNPISFPNTYSQPPQYFHQSLQTPQQPFSFTPIPGFIHNSTHQPSYSSQIPMTYQPKQEVVSPMSSHHYDDSDSTDSVLIGL